MSKKFSFKGSVKAKLIMIMLMVAIVPLVTAVLISYGSSTNKAKTDAQSNLQSQADFIAANIHATFLKNQATLTSLAASPSTIAFIKGEEIDPSLIKKQMDKINELFDDENAIVISNANGDMVLRSDDHKLVSIAEREYFKTAMSGTVCVSDIIISSSTHARDICIAVPIFDNTSKNIIGIIHRSFDLNNFHNTLAEDAEEAFLVTPDGELAAHSQYEISADDEPTFYSNSPYMTSDKDSDVYVSTVTGAPTYVAYTKDAFSGYTICVARSEKEIISEAQKSAELIVIIGLVMLIVIGIISGFIANSFTKPIIEVEKLLSALAEGKFTHINKFTHRTDEFGKIINNSNSVVDKLEAIVGHIKDSSNTVSESSEELSEMANQIAATTETVAEAIQEIASGASEQAKEVQDSAENTGFITDAIESVQSSTIELNSLAARMKDASVTSSDSLMNFQEASKAMTLKIEEISEKISATENAVADINERVEGISDIAAQTNLLSLNASIEAARAGDAGRGFAVVAEEIRKLADDSENLAGEIHEVMEVLLNQSKVAVDAANEIIKDNQLQQEALANTLASVSGMLGDIEITVNSVGKITEETDTCVSSNKVVSNAMASLSAISEENAAATETTGASVEELSATVTTLAESATNLSSIAEKLNNEIAFFQ